MTKFRFLTAGESHGQGLNVIIEGLPSNLDINENYIENDMSRRQKGYGSGGRMKIEKDRAEIKSGVRHGKTLGSPISLWIENKDWKNWTIPMSVEEVDPSEDIKAQTRVVPGHADFAGEVERIISMVDSVLLLVDAVPVSYTHMTLPTPTYV